VVRKLVSPGRLLIAGGVLAAVTFLVLWLVPSSNYLVLPNGAHPVAPLVTVEGAKAGGGRDGIYFVDIVQRKATLLETLFPGLREGSTLVPGSSVNPHGVSQEVRRRADLRQMARSQEIAAAVALRKLGYRVKVREQGALVASLVGGLPAEGKLAPGDIIVGADGKPVRSPADLQQLIGSRRPGQAVRLTVRTGDGQRTVTVGTVASPNDRSRPLIGVLVQPAAQITLPIKVRIDTGEVGGPSAGLAFALDLMEKLGRDVDHGYRVAVTGELGLDGSVGPIGGIKQKTFGARDAGVDVFVVPRANAAEARRYADGLRILPVTSFGQALRRLAALPARQ
jgi:PDZ domain-containing protein